MSGNPLVVGRFLATMENFGTPERPRWRFWARVKGTAACAEYGLNPMGYSSAMAAIDAMRCAEAELAAQLRDETPTEEQCEGSRVISIHQFRSAVTEKVKSPYAE